MLIDGKKIIVGVTGSIAAYKAVLLVRLLQKAGAIVKVVLTEDASKFVGPISFSALVKEPVIYKINDDEQWNNHVLLGRWADLMVIAPATCNTLAKMANGICDNALLAVYLSATCKTMIAPAMDEDMWLHPSTQNNISTLKSFGNIVLNVEKGELASGLIGAGRMAEPEDIVAQINSFFADTATHATGSSYFVGKNILITAGPTYEAIDPVRFIGNYSSGKMGIALANCLAKKGAKVNLVLGPTHLLANDNVNTIRVKSAQQMLETCLRFYPESDVAIMNAAVADYTPEIVANEKIKKKDNELKIQLKKTTDILKTLGESKTHQILVGFALETNDEENYAKQKLQNKNADIIVLNSLNDNGAGFAFDTNKVTIFDKLGNHTKYNLKTKEEVAIDIANYIESYAKS